MRLASWGRLGSVRLVRRPVNKGLIGEFIEIEFLFVTGLDGIVDIFGIGVLGQVRIGADFHEFGDHGMVVMHGKYDHFDMGIQFADLRQGGNPVHDGHLDIQEDHVRLHMFQEIEQLHAVVGFCNQLHVLFNGQGGFYAGPEQGMVVCDDYFNGSV